MKRVELFLKHCKMASLSSCEKKKDFHVSCQFYCNPFSVFLISFIAQLVPDSPQSAQSCICPLFQDKGMKIE